MIPNASDEAENFIICRWDSKTGILNFLSYPCIARRWTTSPRGRSEWWLRLIWVEKVWTNLKLTNFSMCLLGHYNWRVVELQPLWRVSWSAQRQGWAKEATTKATNLNFWLIVGAMVYICSSWRATYELLVRPTLPSVVPPPPKKKTSSHLAWEHPHPLLF